MDESPSYVCPKCGSAGPFYEYAYFKKPVCVACAKRQGAEWRRANPRRKAELGRRKTLKGYGLTEESYAQLLEAQGDSCAICRGASVDGLLVVDHDHATGATRGLLCERCNHGLGHFRDDPDRMLAAVEYLACPPVVRFAAA